MKKKILCLFLCLTLMVSLLPMTAYAAGGFIMVDGQTFYTRNENHSGSGWKWVGSEKCLYLNGYNGSSITTNGDIKIYVNSDSKIHGDFIRWDNSGYECISAGGAMDLILNAKLTLETDFTDYTDWGINCSTLSLRINREGTLEVPADCETAIGFSDASVIECYGKIDCNTQLIEGKGDLDFKVYGSVDVEATTKGIDVAVNMKQGNLNIEGSGDISIGSNYGGINYGIVALHYGSDITVSDKVKLHFITKKECFDVGNFNAKGNSLINLRSEDTAISGNDIIFDEEASLILSGARGVDGFDVTFANKDISAILSGCFAYADSHIYYKPSGLSTINCTSNVFAVDHGTVLFQGNGMDYITSGKRIVSDEYGGCRWQRNGKSVLKSEEDAFTCLYELTGTGELTITSNKGKALCMNLYGGTNGENIEYNGKLTVKESRYGIMSAGPVNINGDCDIEIESVYPAIYANADVNIGGTGTLKVKSDSDAVISSVRGSVNITRDGDINLNDHECIGINSAKDIIIGGSGALNAIGDGPAMKTTDGNIYVRDNRSIDAYVTLNVVEFVNPENSMILEGTGSPISLKSKRDYCRAFVGADIPVVDSASAYTITDGQPDGVFVVYELINNEEDPQADDKKDDETKDGGENGGVNGGGANSGEDGGVNGGGANSGENGGANVSGGSKNGGSNGGTNADDNSDSSDTSDINPDSVNDGDLNDETPRTLVAGEYTEADIPQVPDVVGEAELSVGDFVTRCYKVALERDPDEEGYQYWTDNLNNGRACGAQVGYGFIFGSEYQNKAKTNEEFITDLYSMFFGREADEEGYNYWLNMLSSGVTREEIFAGFANSQEFYNLCKKYAVVSGWFAVGVDNGSQGGVNCFVARLYKVCLGRLPDIEGQRYWVSQLIEGSITGTSASYGFVFSEEFTELNLSDAEFIAYMYAAFFSRKADVEGFNYWLKAIETGISRTDIFTGFTDSAEFTNLCSEYGINP